MRPRLLDPGRGSAKNISQSRKQERKVAKDLGGSVVVASGSRWFSKGDVKAQGVLVECKTTDKQSYILHEADLKKIAAQGIRERRLGLMQLEFSERSTWAIVQWETFKELVDELYRVNSDKDHL
jgi:hypothetical protein